MTPAVAELAGAALDGWDAAAVHAPGGHVFQSRAWARHTGGRGWRPRFLAAGDHRALVLERSWPVIGGASGYMVRGPVGPGRPWAADRSGEPLGAALVAMAAWLAGRGVDVLAADPEVAAGDAGYRRTLDAAGFRPIAELQPSRHRMALDLPANGDEGAVWDGIAKSTRQRIRQAERAGVVAVRWDVAATPLGGASRASEQPADAFNRFFGLLRATGNRLGFDFAGEDEFLPWWRAAHADGLLVYLEAREGAADGDVLGGLVLYRHGTRLSTAHSADRAERRRDHPGAMHLLRWRAIQLALAEGRDEMDLGGVDVAGARRPPVQGEPTFGLYEHKRSYGAQWLELAGAQERVARPWRYGAGRLAARLARAASRGGGA